MILYIDETQNDNYFIVAGVLFDSKETADLTYKQFKKAASHYVNNPKDKRKVFGEFKAVLIDKSYRQIKKLLLTHINRHCTSVIYSSCNINNMSFNQAKKEEIYLKLLSSIIDSVSDNIEVVFDRFNLKTFEDKIIGTFSAKENVISITAADSMSVGGLQFADNICSTIRHFMSDANLDFYEIIAESVENV